MNPNLRDRILRKLDTLSDERGYQVLDYVEFVEAKYAEQPASAANLFQKFADGVEDKLRAGRVSATTISETMGLLNKAVGMLNGVAAAGKSVANDLMAAANSAATPPTGAAAGAPGAPGASPPASAPPSTPSASQPPAPTSGGTAPATPPPIATGDQQP